MDTVGRICSLDTMTMIDGIGLRAIVFLYGCPLRCKFCANPEAAWGPRKSQQQQLVTVQELFNKVARLQAYKLDGITVSGGEPLMQPQFTADLMHAVRARLGMSATLDTSGQGTMHAIKQVLGQTDHVLFCLKSAVPSTYAELTGMPITRALQFAGQLAQQHMPWHLRYVLIPGLTDTGKEVKAMLDFAVQQPSLQAIELLPYHKLGLHKWEALGLTYPMPNARSPTAPEVERVADCIRAAGLQCIV